MGGGLEKAIRFSMAMALAMAGSLLGVVVVVLGFYLKNKYFAMSGFVLIVACVVWGIYLFYLENGEPKSKETVPETEK